MAEKVSVSPKFSQIHEHWHPHIAGELNGQLIKLVRFQGEFVWHHHDNEDEMFFVVKGQFRMEFRDAPSGPKGPDSSGPDSARLEAVPSRSESMAEQDPPHPDEDIAGKSPHSTPSLHAVAPEGRLAGEGARATQHQATQDHATRTVTIKEGEFIIVPRGVEHKPVADEECWVMLFEPASTLNTGNVVNERTVRELKRV